MELAETIHLDDNKGKREKKEHGGGGVGIGDEDNAPDFAVG